MPHSPAGRSPDLKKPSAVHVLSQETHAIPKGRHTPIPVPDVVLVHLVPLARVVAFSVPTSHLFVREPAVDENQPATVAAQDKPASLVATDIASCNPHDIIL